MLDLQEANETASQKLAASEKQLEQFKEENKVLRLSIETSVRDVREENTLLKEQVSSLHTKMSVGNSGESL